jgi:16S rRNA (uracil1498-N3)-methyltransferase
MIFYTPDIHLDDERYTLCEEESTHAVKVLRLKEHDRVTLVDGKGGWYDAVVTQPHPKRCEVQVTDVQREFCRRQYRLHVAIAPTKSIDRFEWFVEKSVEIGIDVITPVLCEHSERKTVSTERIQRIAVAAMKQSGKAYLPEITRMTPFAEWIDACKADRKLIACCGNVEKQSLKNAYLPGEHAAVAIGPEGDFSSGEIDRALAAGFTCITLGKSRLRTETAGIAACHGICFINGE